MPKVRFYTDVPEYRMAGFHLCATTSPAGSVSSGWKRVAFDVDMPPEVWKSHDVAAPVSLAAVVEEPDTEQA